MSLTTKTTTPIRFGFENRPSAQQEQSCTPEKGAQLACDPVALFKNLQAGDYATSISTTSEAAPVVPALSL